jgi:hypothetical protein
MIIVKRYKLMMGKNIQKKNKNMKIKRGGEKMKSCGGI